jgi:outer membrane protein assembly factor BamD
MKDAKQLKDDSAAGIVTARKILAEEAALMAKYEALDKKGKKESDSTSKKTEIKNPQ